MTGLVLVCGGSQFTVEDPPFANVPIGTSMEEGHRIVDEEIGRIHGLIADLQEKIRALKCHRNGLSYVSRLPDDLLVEIWKHLAYSRPQSKNWLGVTHVCSRWRQVAIDSPTLWQEPLFGTEEMTEEMIRRSRNMSLSFEIDFFQPMYNGSPTAPRYIRRKFRTLQEQMHRIKSLSLDLEGLDWGPPLDIKSAPLLTKLSISNSSLCFYTFINFFGGSCPDLTHVSLKECDLLRHAESIQPLPRLIDLSVDTLYRYTQASLQQVIASLKKFPNLRRLSLQNVFEPSEATTGVDTETDFGTLHFPKLETLRVNDSEELGISLMFLGLILYPTSTNVLIEIPDWQVSEDTWPILNLLINRFDPGPKSLVIDYTHKTQIYSFRFGPIEDASTPKGGSVTLQPLFHGKPGMEDFLLRLLTLPVLHDLQSLNYFVPIRGHDDDDFWRSCGNLPMLKTLRLICDQPNLLKILALSIQTNDGPIMRPYFPSLGELVLQDSEGHHQWFDQPSERPTVAFAEECCRVAKVRKEEFHEQFEYKVLVI